MKIFNKVGLKTQRVFVNTFRDRKDAGERLSALLVHYKKDKSALVLGLARGGAIVAHEIAKALLLPLNVIVPRKLGAPNNPELAIGAVAEDGETWLNDELIAIIGVSPPFIQEEIERQKKIIERRLQLYRKGAGLGDLKGKTVILVDDGIATGATMLVEIQHFRKMGSRIVVAAPVAAREPWLEIQKLADEAICLDVEETFYGISAFYESFSQVE